MLQQIFTVYDEKAKAYLPPFFMGQIAQGQRVFADCINSPKHQFGNHPADYTLFHCGEFDDNICHFEIHAPETLGNGVEFRDQTRPISPELDNEKRNAPPVLPDSESGNSEVKLRP